MADDWQDSFRGWPLDSSFAHPDSPAGGAGTGASRSPGPRIDTWSPSGAPYTDSPAGRHYHWRADLQQRQVFANGSDVEKLKRAVERALPKLPAQAREKIEAMLTPEALATLV